MEYRTLGRSGLSISELCLGTMTFGKATSEEESIQIINQFLEDGGNFIDTADVYVAGRSEEIVGKAIKGKRQDVIIATKVRQEVGRQVNDVGYSRKHIMDGIDNSLKRLGTDYIDLYQLHVWDYLTPIDEALRTLDDLVSSGKVRYIGCSNFLAWQIMKSLSRSEQKGYERFISVQPQYSLVSREMDREVMSLCKEEGLAVLPWAPLAGGFLTGKYKGMEKPTFGRFANSVPGEYSWENKASEQNFAVLQKVKDIAEMIGKTPSQVALNWLLMQEGVTSPIFGARTFEQYQENIGAVDWRLTKEQFDELDEVSRLPEEYPNRFIEKFRREPYGWIQGYNASK